MSTWAVSITGRQTERARTVTDWPVTADGRQRDILKGRSRGSGYDDEDRCVEWTQTTEITLKKRKLNDATAHGSVWWRRGGVGQMSLWRLLIVLSRCQCFFPYLRSCPAAGTGWRHEYSCWSWDRWGRCQGSCSGRSRGRCSEGPSMAHLDRTLLHKDKTMFEES